MKKFKCYDCEETFKSETADEMLNLLYPHYMSKHKDIIENNTEVEKEAWMKKFHADWDSTKEE